MKQPYIMTCSRKEAIEMCQNTSKYFNKIAKAAHKNKHLYEK